MSPLVTKEMGDVFYIDHDSKENIRKKYSKDPNVDIDKIVEIDFVNDNRPLAEIVGGRKFDYILASHVFEHIQNPISWLQECDSILKPGGLLSLAIPDKRFTFDYFKELTCPHEWVGSYIEQRNRPSPATVFENATLCNGYDFSGLQKGEPFPRYIKPVNLEWALNHAKDALARHIDVHCTVCTAESFAGLINDSRALGLHRFSIEALFPTQLGWNEFQVRLRTSPVDRP